VVSNQLSDSFIDQNGRRYSWDRKSNDKAERYVEDNGLACCVVFGLNERTVTPTNAAAVAAGFSTCHSRRWLVLFTPFPSYYRRIGCGVCVCFVCKLSPRENIHLKSILYLMPFRPSLTRERKCHLSTVVCPTIVLADVVCFELQTSGLFS